MYYFMKIIEQIFRNRFFPILLVVFGISVTLAGFFININLSELITGKNQFIVLAGGAYLIFGIGLYLFRYVEQGNDTKEFKIEESNYNLLKEIKEIRNQLLHTTINNQEDKIDSEFIDTVIDKKIKKGFDDQFKAFINTEYKEQLSEEYKINVIKDETKELQYGINNQIGKLSRSGTINLIIGLLLSITAILILISLLYNFKTNSYHNLNVFLIEFIPRLSLVIFIEIFSFFFLKLYKRSLDDVKYYQNERTNIDSKVIALKASIIFGKPELINNIIKSFSTVERNFIIKKGESTVNLEKLKIDEKADTDLVEKVLSVIKTFDAKNK